MQVLVKASAIDSEHVSCKKTGVGPRCPSFHRYPPKDNLRLRHGEGMSALEGWETKGPKL